MVRFNYGLLKTVMPFATKANIEKFVEPLNNTLEEFEINTSLRAAHFLAQIAHESGSLRYVRELASGEAYDTGRLAKNLGNTPEADGDGQKYKGRGLIQITGRFNYEALSKAFNVDFINFPEKLEEPEYAARSAGWFWDARSLNTLADAGNFELITRRINGGLNGLKDRQEYFDRARKVMLSETI